MTAADSQAAASDAIRSWLMRKPKPQRVRVYTVDNEIKDYAIPAVKPRWRDCANDLIALNPAKMEAMNGEDDILRPLTVVAEQTEPEPRPTDDPPDIPEALQTDPNALMMTHFANLIHRAYAHTTDVAFDKLLGLVERLDARSEAIERRLEDSEQRYRDEVYDRLHDLLENAEAQAEAGGNPTSKEEILGTLLQAITRGQQAANGKPSGKSNGKRSNGQRET